MISDDKLEHSRPLESLRHSLNLNCSTSQCQTTLVMVKVSTFSPLFTSTRGLRYITAYVSSKTPQHPKYSLRERGRNSLLYESFLNLAQNQNVIQHPVHLRSRTAPLLYVHETSQNITPFVIRKRHSIRITLWARGSNSLLYESYLPVVDRTLLPPVGFTFLAEDLLYELLFFERGGRNSLLYVHNCCQAKTVHISNILVRCADLHIRGSALRVALRMCANFTLWLFRGSSLRVISWTQRIDLTLHAKMFAFHSFRRGSTLQSDQMQNFSAF